MVTQAQFYGPEPVVKDKELTKLDLIKIYNWYNQHYDNKDAKVFLEKYLVAIKHPHAGITEKIPNHNYTTLGWIAKIALGGGKFPNETRTWFALKLKDLIGKAAGSIVAEGEQNQGELIQQRLNEQYEETLGIFEQMVDLEDSGFEPYTYLAANEVKGYHAQRIADYYKPLAREITEVLTNKDPQLKEAYVGWTNPQLRRFSETVHLIISDCERFAGNVKVARKPRKRKAKAASKIVAKVKYKVSDDRFKIKSINPEEIVGANQLWVFNTKTRKLGVYVALNNDRLSVKGTTLLNYDPEKSVQKVVRKPELVLSTITQGGKVALRTVMSDINAVESPLSGRINADSILLKAVKG